MEQGNGDEVIAVRHRIRPHWQLLGQEQGLAALDALLPGDRTSWACVEDTFHCCERALMTAQRALLT